MVAQIHTPPKKYKPNPMDPGPKMYLASSISLATASFFQVNSVFCEFLMVAFYFILLYSASLNMSCFLIHTLSSLLFFATQIKEKKKGPTLQIPPII